MKILGLYNLLLLHVTWHFTVNSPPDIVLTKIQPKCYLGVALWCFIFNFLAPLIICLLLKRIDLVLSTLKVFFDLLQTNQVQNSFIVSVYFSISLTSSRCCMTRISSTYKNKFPYAAWVMLLTKLRNKSSTKKKVLHWSSISIKEKPLLQ